MENICWNIWNIFDVTCHLLGDQPWIFRARGSMLAHRGFVRQKKLAWALERLGLGQFSYFLLLFFDFAQGWLQSEFFTWIFMKPSLERFFGRQKPQSFWGSMGLNQSQSKGRWVPETERLNVSKVLWFWERS